MNVGDYKWSQVSAWGFTPKKCIEKYIDVSGTTCVFFLQQVTEIVVEDKQWKVKTVESLDGVPVDVLTWRNKNYRVKSI